MFEKLEELFKPHLILLPNVPKTVPVISWWTWPNRITIDQKIAVPLRNVQRMLTRVVA